MIRVNIISILLLVFVINELVMEVNLKPASCDLFRRNDTCPTGFCCARDEFLPQYTVCRPIGQINDSCSPVADFSICHCEEGLICVSNVNSGIFASVYGTCLPNITTTTTTSTTQMTTEALTTIAPTTRPKKHFNHPPQIQLNEKEADVSKYSNIGDIISTFIAKDGDTGQEGMIRCMFLQLNFFTIKNVQANTFQIIVAKSLKDLSPQKFSDYIMCQDGGSPPANGIAQFVIEIKDTHNVLTTAPTKISSSKGISEEQTTADESTTGLTTETETDGSVPSYIMTTTDSSSSEVQNLSPTTLTSHTVTSTEQNTDFTSIDLNTSSEKDSSSKPLIMSRTEQYLASTTESNFLSGQTTDHHQYVEMTSHQSHTRMTSDPSQMWMTSEPNNARVSSESNSEMTDIVETTNIDISTSDFENVN